MAVVASRRSVITLYSGSKDLFSHRVRIVLAEKGVGVDVIEVNMDSRPEELMEINPYGTVPTLVDRDLVLYRSQIIMEYLDERFPHPPLLPVYPVARAKSRLMIARIDKDWYSLVEKIQFGDEEVSSAAKKQLQESLLSVVPVFMNSKFFLSEEFSLIDCCIAPILWRLPALGIELPAAKAKAINAYTERVFDRQAFQASLTDAEREMREQFVC